MNLNHHPRATALATSKVVFILKVTEFILIIFEGFYQHQIQDVVLIERYFVEFLMGLPLFFKFSSNINKNKYDFWFLNCIIISLESNFYFEWRIKKDEISI